MRTKRWLQAKTYLTQILAVSNAGQYISAGYTIAWNLGDFPGAAEYARKLVQTGYGDSPEYLLASALHALGNDAEALTMAEKGITDAKSPAIRGRFLSLRASIQKQSNPDGAIKDLRTALLADGDNLNALLLLAELLAAGKQYHGAVLYLKHAATLTAEDSGIKARIAELEKLAESQKK
jgi:tetratricopeptide (TPR) repeat protein